MLGLLFVPGGQGAVGARAAASTEVAVGQAAVRGIPWLTQQISQASVAGVRLAPVLARVTKAMLYGDVVATAGTAGLDVAQTVQEMRTGVKTLADGTTRPMTEDDMFEALQRVVFAAIAGKGMAQSLKSKKPAEAPKESEAPPKPAVKEPEKAAAPKEPEAPAAPKEPEAPAAPKEPEAPATPKEAQAPVAPKEPTAAAPKPAEPPAAASAPKSAQQHLDELRGALSEGARKKLENMTRGKPPEEALALIERKGGKDFLEGEAQAGAAKQATRSASPDRAKALKAELSSNPEFLGRPEVKKAIDSNNPTDLRGEMAVEVAAREAAAKHPNTPGLRVYKGVKVYRKQPYATIDEFREAFRKANGGKEYEGVVTRRGDGVYTLSTDIDVLVVQERGGQPAKILRGEEVKSGKGDLPSEAAEQIGKAKKRLSEAGDQPIRLELNDGTEVTSRIDASSAPDAKWETRGPVGGKEFDNSLGMTPEDLLKAAKEMIDEQAKKEKK
jgi:outer membrane biosynthesis protein TonB